MPLTFLNPALLFGALGAVIPVVIHFLSRRRTRQIAFSDLRFLTEAESQQSRRRGIRRWLLLLLRVLAVLCLALAMSRPHWGALAAGGEGGRTVLILLDTSASMQTQGDDGRTRFELALAQAQDLVAALPASSTVQVLTMGAEARPLFAGWLPAGTSAGRALTAATVTDGPCNLAAGLREAARQVTNAPATPVEVVLLSDLQAAEWTGLDEAARQFAGAGETRLLVHRLGDGMPGGGVLGVELPARALRSGEAATLTATVIAERAQQPVYLELGGRRMGEALVAEAGGPFTVSFSLAVPGPGRYHGAVRKESDRFPADDVRPFVIEVPARLEILLVHGEDRDALGRGGWRYLQRALAPGNDPESPFRVRDLAVTEFTDGDLAEADMLILVDTGPLGRRLQDAVRAWLTAGGAVLALAGDPTQAADLETGLLPLLGLGGGAVFRSRDDADAERARIVDPGHPILADLGPDALATLGEATWTRYFVVAEGEARVLLAAASGASLLCEGEAGAGRWALMPFDLMPDATDLAMNPVFLPLVQRLVATLAWLGPGRARGAIEVGEPVSLRLRPGRGVDAAQLRLLTPPDGRVRPAALTWQGEAPVVSGEASRQAGIYAFVAGDDTLGLVAAAVPTAESGAAFLTPAQLAERLGLPTVDLRGASGAGLERALAGRDLAPWFIVAALVLLAVELFVGRRV
jgi:hypothetical protein